MLYDGLNSSWRLPETLGNLPKNRSNAAYLAWLLRRKTQKPVLKRKWGQL